MLIRKLRGNVAELGAFNAFLYGVSRVLARLTGNTHIYKYYFAAQPVPDQGLLPEMRGRSFTVRPVPEGDPVTRQFPPPPPVIAGRYRQGAVCLGLFKDQELAGYAWLCLGPYDEDEVRCRFQPLPEGASAWDFDVYLVPKYRVGLAFPRLWDEVNAYLRERGYRWTLSRISAFNRASLTSHKRLGARLLGSAVFIVFGKWQLMAATVPPYLDLSTGPARVPGIRLHAPAESR